jgi:glycosyltransferase involved in cell wall biosynthesis
MNTAPYLPALFNALGMQTGRDIEFIFVNDGSSDESPALLDAFASQDVRARVIHTDNGGVSRARNLAIRAARGRFLAFCDSDDLPDANCYVRLLEHALQMQTVVVIGNGAAFHGEPSGEDAPLLHADTPTGQMAGGAFLANRVYADNMPYTVFLALVDRQWLLEQQIFFPEGIVHEDVLWYVKLLFAAPSIYIDSACHYHYRLHDASITGKRTPEHLWHRLRSYCKLLHYLLDCSSPQYPGLVERIAMVQFQHALWLLRALPFHQRMRGYRLMQQEKVIKRLRPHATRPAEKRRLARCLIMGFLAQVVG